MTSAVSPAFTMTPLVRLLRMPPVPTEEKSMVMGLLTVTVP
jgi:hypothetical protein